MARHPNKEIEAALEYARSKDWTILRGSPTMAGQAQREYRYYCVISGIAEITPELSHAVFEALDAEIELNLRDGICYLECARHASSLRDAVTSTINELERSVTGLRVVRVETDDSNVIARINSELLSAVGAP